MFSLAISVLIGLLVGILSGLLGIGGGVIMVPVFRLGLGMTALESIATSLFVIVPTSITGSISRLRNKTCVPAAGVAAGLGGACTSPLGVYLASISPSWAIMLAAAVIIVYSAVEMFRKALSLPKSKDASSLMETGEGGAREALERRLEEGGARELSERDEKGNEILEATPSLKSKHFNKRIVFISLLIGLLAGIGSGYVGVGGGFVMVPLFITVLGLSMKKASGTSLIAVSILAIPGVVEQMMLGNVLVGAGIAVALGSIPGALIGASLSKKMPERQLRLMFGVLLFVAAVMLVFKESGI